MSRRNFWVHLTAILGLVAALGFTACSDDDGNKDAGVDTISATDATQGTDTVSNTNLCQNSSDLAAVAREDYGTSGDQTLGEVASAAGLACISNLTADCINGKIATATDNAVSASCISCYTDSVLCAAVNCFSACSSNPSGAACEACRCGDNTNEVNCVTSFTTCSGIPSSSECTPASDGGVDDAAATDAGTDDSGAVDDAAANDATAADAAAATDAG